MAKSGKTSKKKQPSDFTKRLAIILFLLAVLSVTIFGFVNIYFYTEDTITADELPQSIYNDLELATRPFDEVEEFSLKQIFNTPIWGTLNSGHYFSLKLSSPNSLETSLLWFANKLNQNGRLNVRHLCDQNDNLNSYSWLRHDFYTFGEQEIHDGGYRLRTTFVKNPANSFEWKTKIDVEFATDKILKPLSLIQYITTDRQSDKLILKSSRGDFKSKQTLDKKLIEISGYSKDVGDFSMSLNFESDQRKLVAGNHFVGNINKQKYPVSLWLQTKLIYDVYNASHIFILPGAAKQQKHPYIEDDLEKQPNIIAYEIIITGSASFTIDFQQSLADTFLEFDHKFDATFSEKVQEFDQHFMDLFPIEQPKPIQTNARNSVDRLAKVALSNMIGGVGYFYGHSYISNGGIGNKVVPYGPIQLLTGVPSRSYFPRGFLWDEAFHNLLISQFDSNLSNRIIESWFNLMNVNGWIPREVILGPESLRRVPEEFIVQQISNANPPAMFIVIKDLFLRGKLEKATLQTIYPRLKTWYKWFNSTQSGPKPGTFRWRGRDEFSVSMLNPKTLTSGLDDYPRPSHPSPLEYHVDLRCWMAFSAKTLAILAKYMKDQEFYEQISSEAEELYDNKQLDALHWSDENKMYCDYGYDTDEAELRRVTKTRRSADGKRDETYQALERHSTGHPKFGCVKEFGYVSLFPMLFNILDHKSEKLGILLDKMRNGKEIWSQFGIRSLSRLSRYYNKYNTEHDKPYWRGAIWLNLNYLILSSLDHYSKLAGPYQDKCAKIFLELKENLVNNVVNEYSRTNYTWENYDDQTGQGKGSHPFSGWSSLILLIMSNTKSEYL